MLYSKTSPFVSASHTTRAIGRLPLLLKLVIPCDPRISIQDANPIRHSISTFERRESVILDPIVLAISVFVRLSLLVRIVEQILHKAEAYPNRNIVIGTLEDIHKPVVLHLTKSASFNDPGLKAVSTTNLRHAVNEIGSRGGSQSNLGGHHIEPAPDQATRCLGNLRQYL